MGQIVGIIDWKERTACATCAAPVSYGETKDRISGLLDPDGELHQCQPLSITTQTCDQCYGPGPTVIVGQDYGDPEASAALVCATCIAKAAAALSRG